VDRIVSFYAPEHSAQIRLALVNALRGIVAQVLTDRRGGKVVVREVVNAPDVAACVAGGMTDRSTDSGSRRPGAV
jgi:Tfp pilus assembly pilus retraction ATPase PilT